MQTWNRQNTHNTKWQRGRTFWHVSWFVFMSLKKNRKRRRRRRGKECKCRERLEGRGSWTASALLRRVMRVRLLSNSIRTSTLLFTQAARSAGSLATRSESCAGRSQQAKIKKKYSGRWPKSLSGPKSFFSLSSRSHVERSATDRRREETHS